MTHKNLFNFFFLSNGDLIQALFEISARIYNSTVSTLYPALDSGAGVSGNGRFY